MSFDESGTLASLQAHRSELIVPAIARHHGRVVKLMGDGILAAFGSVVEAVECAAEIQREMAARNAGVSDDRRLGFRIGVHLGDVIVEGDDIYGDGVNIAARLESLAETGGICISRQAYDQVDEISFDLWVSDLETVIDAVGLPRFPLLGVSQGCAISIAYAVRHPERVSRLVLYGGFALGASKRSPAAREKLKAMATLVRLEWGADNPAIRHMFATEFYPDAPKEVLDTYGERQRITTTGECAARYLETTGDIDVTDLLHKVAVTTLVMHRRGDLRQPIELGRQRAAGIPGARFGALV